MGIEVSLKDGVYYVKGDITETCDLAKAGIPGGPVRLDLSGVRSVNSSGVRQWILALRALKIQPIYMNCSPPVVMQFNMVPDFLANEAKVESFIVPGYCDNCGKQFSFTLVSGKDFKPGKAPEFELPKCGQPACAIDSDVDFESYFYFIDELQP